MSTSTLTFTNKSLIRAINSLFLGLLALLFTLPALAQKDEYDSWMISGNTKLWLDTGISISNVTHVILLPVDDATDAKKLSPEVLTLLTSIIKERLKKDGITVLSPGEAGVENSIKLKPFVTKYKAGSATDRWIMPGTGATECIIRASILSSKSNAVIGEIITWKSVSSGGLFTLGADKSVPKAAAESIASTLIKHIRKSK